MLTKTRTYSQINPKKKSQKAKALPPDAPAPKRLLSIWPWYSYKPSDESIDNLRNLMTETMPPRHPNLHMFPKAKRNLKLYCESIKQQKAGCPHSSVSALFNGERPQLFVKKGKSKPSKLLLEGPYSMVRSKSIPQVRPSRGINVAAYPRHKENPFLMDSYFVGHSAEIQKVVAQK